MLTGRPDGPVIPLEGDVLFRQQSSGNRVYLIESGRLAIVRERADGSEEQLAERAAGEYVGELGPPRSA